MSSSQVLNLPNAYTKSLQAAHTNQKSQLPMPPTSTTCTRCVQDDGSNWPVPSGTIRPMDMHISHCIPDPITPSYLEVESEWKTRLQNPENIQHAASDMMSSFLYHEHPDDPAMDLTGDHDKPNCISQRKKMQKTIKSKMKRTKKKRRQRKRKAKFVNLTPKELVSLAWTRCGCFFKNAREGRNIKKSKKIPRDKGKGINWTLHPNYSPGLCSPVPCSSPDAPPPPPPPPSISPPSSSSSLTPHLKRKRKWTPSYATSIATPTTALSLYTSHRLASLRYLKQQRKKYTHQQFQPTASQICASQYQRDIKFSEWKRKQTELQNMAVQGACRRTRDDMRELKAEIRCLTALIGDGDGNGNTSGTRHGMIFSTLPYGMKYPAKLLGM